MKKWKFGRIGNQASGNSGKCIQENDFFKKEKDKIKKKKVLAQALRWLHGKLSESLFHL